MSRSKGRREAGNRAASSSMNEGNFVCRFLTVSSMPRSCMMVRQSSRPSPSTTPLSLQTAFQSCNGPCSLQPRTLLLPQTPREDPQPLLRPRSSRNMFSSSRTRTPRSRRRWCMGFTTPFRPRRWPCPLRTSRLWPQRSLAVGVRNIAAL